MRTERYAAGELASGLRLWTGMQINGSHDISLDRPRGGARETFRRFASWSSVIVGSAPAFLASLVFCVLWAASGPMFHFSDTWQLVVNTVTSIVTFLMVFLIQYSQNRDTQAMQLKLDELLRVVEGTRPHMMRIEESPDEVLAELEDDMRDHREHLTER